MGGCTLILVNRRAKHLVDLIYSFLDQHYDMFKTGNINAQFQIYVDHTSMDIPKELFKDEPLQEAVRQLLIKDGWASVEFSEIINGSGRKYSIIMKDNQ